MWLQGPLTAPQKHRSTEISGGTARANAPSDRQFVSPRNISVFLCFCGAVRGAYKKGEPDSAPLIALIGRTEELRDTCSARSTLNLSRMQTSRADLDLRDFPFDDNPRDLEIRLPDTTRAVVRMGNVIAVRHTLIADVTAVSCNRH